MITLTLEMDFPESDSGKILQKLSELLEKSDKVKVKELRVGEKIVDTITAPISYPQQTSPYSPWATTTPSVTWTCGSSLVNDSSDHYSVNLCSNTAKFERIENVTAKN